MLTYNLMEIEGSLYENLYRLIKEDIYSGKLKPNEKMPSKRMFATNLGVSTITVENAYEQLISEGYIYSKPKVGYFVSEISSIPKAKTQEKISRNIDTGNKDDIYPKTELRSKLLQECGDNMFSMQWCW